MWCMKEMNRKKNNNQLEYQEIQKFLPEINRFYRLFHWIKPIQLRRKSAVNTNNISVTWPAGHVLLLLLNFCTVFLAIAKEIFCKLRAILCEISANRTK